MKKSLLAVASAGVLAAGAALAPTSASANPAWIVPALIAAGVGGVTVGALAASGRPALAGPRAYYDDAVAPTVVAPRGCYPARARIGGVWRRVQICN